MAADVVQRAQFAVAAAHDEQRHAGDLRQRVVAGAGDLRGMRHQLPAACEHGLALGAGELHLRVARRRQRRGGLRRLWRERRVRGFTWEAVPVVHGRAAADDAGHCRYAERA
jgi:hypothetical protein